MTNTGETSRNVGIILDNKYSMLIFKQVWETNGPYNKNLPNGKKQQIKGKSKKIL